MDRGAWWAIVHGVAKRVEHNPAIKKQTRNNRNVKYVIEKFKSEVNSDTVKERICE